MALLKNVLLASSALLLASGAPIAPSALTVQKSIVGRSSHEHDHSHEHLHLHEHTHTPDRSSGVPLKVSPKYDEDHSQHWNFRHGYVNKDGHGHGPPSKRSEGELEVREMMDKRHQENKKVGKSNKHSSHSGKKAKKPFGRKGKKTAKVVDAKAKVGQSGDLFKATANVLNNVVKTTVLRARHSDRWKEHHHLDLDLDHDHEHVHSHVHERSRRSADSLAVAGVPGFVEVASPLFNSSLARSIAGLVFTSSSNGTDPSSDPIFSLGTSTTQSTQFYLVQALTQRLGLNVVNIKLPVLNSQSLKTEDYCATFDLAPPSPMSLAPCGEVNGFSQEFAYNSTTGELKPLYGSTPAPMALVQRPDGEKDEQTSSSASATATMTSSATATESSSTASATETDDAATSTIINFAAASVSSSSSASASGSSSTSSDSAAFPTATVKHSFAAHNGSTTSSPRSDSNLNSAKMPSINQANADADSTTSAGSDAAGSDEEEDEKESISLYFVPASAYYQPPSFISSFAKSTADSSQVEDGAPEGIDSATASSTATDSTTATASATASASATGTTTEAAPLSTMTVSASSDTTSPSSAETTSDSAAPTSTATSSSSTDSASASATATPSRRLRRSLGRW